MTLNRLRLLLMPKVKVSVYLPAILVFASVMSCDKRPLDPRGKYTGTWEVVVKTVTHRDWEPSTTSTSKMQLEIVKADSVFDYRCPILITGSLNWNDRYFDVDRRGNLYFSEGGYDHEKVGEISKKAIEFDVRTNFGDGGTRYQVAGLPKG